MAQTLLYFADPMCSWCWGFSPVIDAIRARFPEQLPIRLILGGLRPGVTTPMNSAARASTREHWIHVSEASGQPFDFSFFDRAEFVYDTEPASRAVAVMRRQGMPAALNCLKRLQHAFYAENKDVTDPGVLADIAAEFGYDRARFLSDLEAPRAIKETWLDFGIAQGLGIAGFPTLVIGPTPNGAYEIITRGFQPASSILPALQDWIAARQVPA